MIEDVQRDEQNKSFGAEDVQTVEKDESDGVEGPSEESLKDEQFQPFEFLDKLNMEVEHNSFYKSILSFSIFILKFALVTILILHFSTPFL